ncbi:hypothetical protein [Spirosoma migulaei]
MSNSKSRLFFFPNRFCSTIPVSTTGSLWVGYGGFHYTACSFLLTKLDPGLGVRTLRAACQFIPVGFYYVTTHYPSRHLRSRLRKWIRIDDSLLVSNFRSHFHKWAA